MPGEGLPGRTYVSSDRVIQVWTFGGRQRDRWATGYRWAASQPGWIARLALLTFLLIIVLPIALLVGLAILAGAAVFGGLALVNAGISRLKGAVTGDGRSNVRVIRRDSTAEGR